MNDGLSPRRERPFGFTFASDVLAEPPLKFWHVRGIIASRELSVVYGAPGDGKSVIVGDIACHASSGLDWFGHEVSQAVGVLYIAAERADLVKRRIAAFMLVTGVQDMPFVVVEASPDLTKEDDVNRVLDTVYTAMDDEKASGPAWEDFDGFSWIIVDTKARTMGGADENAAKDMNRFVAGLARLQSRLCAHVTVIDHTPHHDKGRMRGHSALLGAADVTFRISRMGSARRFEIDKVNDGPDDISHAFDLRTVVVRTHEDGEEQTAPSSCPWTVAPWKRRSRPLVSTTARRSPSAHSPRSCCGPAWTRQPASHCRCPPRPLI
jgi:hypothetical protein